MNGKFIVVEGLDGSGKGTQLAMLSEWFEKRNIPVRFTCEPTDRPTGRLIREALGGRLRLGPDELAGLFLADRICHNSDPDGGIKALVNGGCNVFCDRYYYSSLSYQGMDIGLDWLMPANLECPSIMKPDVCIFLDVPTKIADERIAAGRESREIFEKIETLERVRRQYFKIFEQLKGHNIRVVDASRTPEEVFEDVSKAVGEIL